MSLKKSFNFEFLKQNLKKSKGVLAVFIGLVPILNILSYVLSAIDMNYFIPTLEKISVINYLGSYIIPIIVSTCLFGFVFKKKSVDFIGSMPISKKTIFVTNSIGGMLILILMNLVTVIAMLVVNLIFANIYMPVMILFDYLIVWSITYIFVFTISNIAISVSGNAITSIAVSMLIMFLVPFVTDYSISKIDHNNYYQEDSIVCNEEDCTPSEYYCYNNDKCLMNKAVGVYKAYLKKDNNSYYTFPYKFVHGIFFYDGEDDVYLYNTIEIIRMLVLSIIYFFVGLILFTRRKYEVSETSFKSDRVHLIVKGLTLVPMIVFAVEALRAEASGFVSIFIFVVILAYYLIFDLITRKSLVKFSKNVLGFIISIAIIGSFILVIGNLKSQGSYKIDTKDIKGITLLDTGFVMPNQEVNNVYVENKNLINLIVKNYLDNGGIDNKPNRITVKIKMKDNTIYKLDNDIFLSDSDYEKVLTYLNGNKKYLDTFKKINKDKIYAISTGNQLYHKNDNKELIDTIIKAMEKTDINTYRKLPSGYTVNIYTYDNHKSNIYNINVAISDNLLETIINNNNLSLKSALEKYNSNNVFGYSCRNCDDPNNDLYYLMQYAKDEVIDFIKNNIDKKVDIHEKMLTIDLYYYESYSFVTNEVEAFYEMIDEVRQKVKDTKEYQQYTGDINYVY